MDPSKLPPRDIVMKGGITSGVVYPGAVRRLAEHYRFRALGGSSAGAIAAAVTAAAEYGRQQGQGTGMAQLDTVTEELGRDRFLLSLFQPAAGVRELWEILLELVARVQSERKQADEAAAGTAAVALPPPRRRRLGARLAALAALMALRRAPDTLRLVFGLLTALAGVLVAIALTDPAGLLAWLALGALGAGALAVALTASVAWALARLLRQSARALPDSDYGFCPGSSQDGSEALVEWLHRHIQAAAGLDPEGVPLTFEELERVGIRLAMTTTDLSYARPVPVPLPDGAYLFEPKVWLARFPRPVVAHMIAAARGLPDGAEPAPEDWRTTHYIPGKRMPVLVGVRLSLSFPLLLSAMPLRAYWTMADDPEHVNLFSDGGICSNFPIHFFDAWFPRTPTFGFDLVYRTEQTEPRVGSAAEVEPPRWKQVRTIGEFARQLRDATQNWRDALQSELPGYRDRVCQIPMPPGLGGLNLRMSPEQIGRLVEQGECAADALHRDFRWERHRFVRYLTLMELLQQNLRSLAEADSFPSFADHLAAGIPDGEPFAEDHGPAWGGAARAQTEALLAVAAGWGPPPGEVDFAQAPLPAPRPTMRVVPEG